MPDNDYCHEQNYSEDCICATEKEAIARVTELNKDNREYPELD